MIRVFGDQLLYSPFDFPEYIQKFKEEQIKPTTDLNKADLIASSYLSVLKKHAQNFRETKKYLLWSHEPYHNWKTEPIYQYQPDESKQNKTPNTTPNTKQKSKNKTIPIHIMNVYTGDVFTHNLRYFYFDQLIEPPNQIDIPLTTTIQQILTSNQSDKTKNTKKLVVAFSTYYKKEYYQDNSFTTLPLRYKLIEYGYQNNLLDVHGKDWQNHKFVKSIANTRNGKDEKDRREIKSEIFQDYYFNLALENTDFPYYVTEKIWEPINSNCLPIYRSNETIYQSFPKNSFIDTKDFDDDPEKIYTYLNQMTLEEYQTRVKRCQQVFNEIVKTNQTTLLTSKNENINYLEYESCYQTLLTKIKTISST